MHTGQARTLLAFGDSNTYGIVPGTRRRYRPDQRWTGVLQQRCGPGWDVIESGLPGRTTDLEDVVTGRPDRAGLPVFRAVHESVDPDVVVLALGTNDLRVGSGRTDPQRVADALGGYVDHVVARARPASSVIVVAPQPVREPDSASGVPDLFGEAGRAATDALVGALAAMAADRGAAWLDVTGIATTGRDGAHLDARSHRLLGERLADVVRRGPV